MADVAKNITNLRTPEQESQPQADEKPWLRQKNEPAAWYLRFKRYLDLGTKRSLRKALAGEPSTDKATKGDKKQPESEQKKLSDVSVPGAWSRAAKVWRWSERAQAYDLAEQEKRAVQIRKMVSASPYASRAYRILKLDYLARLLREQIKLGMALDNCLAVTARYQSVIQQIAAEMKGLDDSVTQDMCDASAMITIRQEAAEEEYKQKTKGRGDIDKVIAQIDRYEALQALEKQRPQTD